GRRSGAALGSGAAEPVEAGRQTAGGVPAGVQGPAEAPAGFSLGGGSAPGVANPQWGGGSGGPEGGHGTAEAVGHAREESGGGDDSALAGAPVERRMVGGLQANVGDPQ